RCARTDPSSNRALIDLRLPREPGLAEAVPARAALLGPRPARVEPVQPRDALAEGHASTTSAPSPNALTGSLPSQSTSPSSYWIPYRKPSVTYATAPSYGIMSRTSLPPSVRRGS